MTKLKTCILILAVLMALTACGQEETAPEDPVSSETVQPPAVDVTPTPQAPDSLESASPEIVTEDDTLPPSPGMVRSPLTNEWVDPEVAETRPIAVIIANEVNAIPHYDLSEASVVYEANVEGRMSRLMAIYEDWWNLEKIGNVRSLRTYYMYWAFEWDAFAVHFGGPYFINDLLAAENTQTVDGNLDSDGSAFFRTSDRPAPHNGYASGPELSKVIDRKGYPRKYRGLTDANHFVFAGKLNPNTLSQYGAEAKNATYVDMSGCYPLTRCYFEFNEEDGLYYRSQHLSGSADGPHADSDGTQLTFKNILVQYVKYEELGGGYLAFQCHDTTRDGWYFTNGKGIHVNWEKTTDYGATRYYDDYGNEITMNTGKTMICIIEEDDNFTFR
ncbi:MAG: DUF3048 domain-containing protein [Lachnospiraceae bacterium]|nr:DUF3048 domain-containing protein [Lachnospiraceae bacterium]